MKDIKNIVLKKISEEVKQNDVVVSWAFMEIVNSAWINGCGELYSEDYEEYLQSVLDELHGNEDFSQYNDNAGNSYLIKNSRKAFKQAYENIKGLSLDFYEDYNKYYK